MTDEQARINAGLGVYGGFDQPPLADGTDKFLRTQEPDVQPVDDLSRFVLARIIELELEPRGEIDVFKNPEHAMAYRYAKHVRADCVVFRQIVALYVGVHYEVEVELDRSTRQVQQMYLSALREAVLAVANRWADHHEFDEAWRLA